MSIALSAERESELIVLARSARKSERDAAFAEIVRALGPMLHSLCVGITGSRVDADDAVQDTLCTVASELGRFRGEARLFTWCYRIALRAAVRVRTKNRPRTDTEPPPARSETGDSSVDQDDARQLLATMAQLPIEQRAVLTLFAEGHTHDEIAAILDVPTGTVWSRLHSGKKRLRELLK
jgi:RNA polymerase sigma-70 factor (ECF subfamily)